jgi:hypothetical protein
MFDGNGGLERARCNNPQVIQVLGDVKMPTLDSHLAYPEEARSVARLHAFRDFLITRAQGWAY